MKEIDKFDKILVYFTDKETGKKMVMCPKENWEKFQKEVSKEYSEKLKAECRKYDNYYAEKWERK